ncbi:hypothetical protein RHECNPAF_2940051 [Rhizobium etli CNPAF512]|nr:hypothetical protein RHECNPAF_2940051 [Rhizobium etli CNPAF512]
MFRCSSRLFRGAPYRGRDLDAEQFDRAAHGFGFERRRAHLERHSGNTPQRRARFPCLGDDGLRTADQKGAARAAHRLELGARRRQPAPFPAGLRHHLLPARKEGIPRSVIRIADEAHCVHTDLLFCRRMAGCRPGVSIEIDERPETFEMAADDGDHQRQAECAGAGEGFGRSADTKPDGQPILMRTRINPFAIERWAEAALPFDMRRLVELEQEIELFDEQCVIIPEIVAKERIGIDERAAADHQFGPSAGDEIEGGKLLEHAHRIGRTDDGNSACQPDSPGPRSRCRQDHCRSRIERVLAVMLTHAEDIEADGVGQFHLGEHPFHAVGRRLQLPRFRVGRKHRKTVDTDFHGSVLPGQVVRISVSGFNRHCRCAAVRASRATGRIVSCGIRRRKGTQAGRWRSETLEPRKAVSAAAPERSAPGSADCVKDDGEGAAVQPGYAAGDQKQNDRRHWTAADDEEMGQNGEGHCDGKQQRTEGCRRRNQQGNRSGDLHSTRQEAEPLAGADLVEDRDHHRDTRELGAAGSEKCRRREAPQAPGDNLCGFVPIRR